jgi:hypothetical protein
MVMYIDIMPNDNLDEAVMATFRETGPGRAISAIRLSLDGTWTWCAVVSWHQEEGPRPARLTPIEESGDGPALLVSGGDCGLRLARLEDPDSAPAVAWDLDAADQWSEGFLICRPQTDYRS